MSEQMKRLEDIQEETDNADTAEVLPGPQTQIFTAATLYDLVELYDNDQLLYGDIIIHTPTNCLWTVTDPDKLPSLDALRLLGTSDMAIAIEDAKASWIVSLATSKPETTKSNRILEAMRADGLIN